MGGLKFVCAQVFGIDMKAEELCSSEVWTPDCSSGSGYSSSKGESNLLKYSFTGPQGEALGFMYFDLYARPDKFTGAAHFTIRYGCSNLTPSNTTNNTVTNNTSTSNTSSSSRSDIKTPADSSSQAQQLPVVALVFNFPSGASLSVQALDTLYHEVGHGLHSLLSRTKFQHLSGTRGSTDFVEVIGLLTTYCDVHQAHAYIHTLLCFCCSSLTDPI
jgi:intermediate peptidase